MPTLKRLRPRRPNRLPAPVVAVAVVALAVAFTVLVQPNLTQAVLDGLGL